MNCILVVQFIHLEKKKIELLQLKQLRIVLKQLHFLLFVLSVSRATLM